MNKGLLLGLLLGSTALVSPAWGQAPPTQCVTTAVGGGTPNAITIPQLPCVPTTSLLILTPSGTNTSSTVTLQAAGDIARSMVRYDGSPIQAGDLKALSKVQLVSDGTKWFLLTLPPIGGGAISGAPAATSNSALQALSTANTSSVIRSGFAAAGDGPAVTYYASGSACSLNSGAGDGGSQIPSADGKCWLAQPTGLLDGRMWGVSILPTNFYVNDATGADGTSKENYCISSAHPCKTVNQCVKQALKFSPYGINSATTPPNPINGNLICNIAAGDYYENIVVHGTLSAGSSNLPILHTGSQPQLSLIGAGSPNTRIHGGIQNGLGQSFCYAILANAGAQLGLKGMTIDATSTPSSCTQSGIYAQFFGTVYVLGDVTVGQTKGYQVFAEEYGFIQVTGGLQSVPGLNFKTDGSGPIPGAIGLSANSAFNSDAVLTFEANPSYNNTVFLLEDNSNIKLFGNPATSLFGNNSLQAAFTGKLFHIDSSSVFHNINGPAVGWSGTYGTVTGGGRWRGTVPAVTIGSPTGCGSTCAAPITAGSNAYSGTITLTPGGTGITSGASIPLTLPHGFDNPSCNISYSNYGTASPSVGYDLFYTLNGKALTINISNGASAVLPSGTIPISWVCDG